MIEHLKDVNEKHITLSSQFESQVNNLMQERARLLEEIETYKSSPVVTTDSDTQTDDPQHEKLVDSNHELKHTLQAFKDKVHRIVAERPDLFDNIGEETSERLDHLISTVENQATQIHVLQTEMKEFRRYEEPL
jgi:transketolase